MKIIALRKYWIRTLLLLLLYSPVTGIAQDQDSTIQAETAEYAPLYDRRKVPDEVVQRLKADKKLQYHDKDVKEVEPPRLTFLMKIFEVLISLRHVIKIVVIVLLIGGLGWLLHTFMRNNGISIFRKPKLIDGVEELQDESLQSSKEYEEKIKAAVKDGDIRQAVRWWYLYTLFQLANRQLIAPSREKTNNDYVRGIRNTPYYKTFSTLTMNYEYIWYGGFNVSEENYREIDRQFRDFNNILGKDS
ncbi:MAG TPA: hypothetical protein VM802_21315 [Chitinophaga sp.]|uniref:hypothetical protein n=1 Tax=Chitinophaga sp. TaxID=1869181 RepID=UPI002B831CE3|nr:hypothetical protein [Chitinophaga sp.]HVI47427.1 hypothetical protein [Chitinophaga sp.]